MSNRTIAIIARPSQTYSLRRFVEEAKKCNVDVQPVDPLTIAMSMVSKETPLFFSDRAPFPHARGVFRATVSTPATVLEDVYIDSGANHLWVDRNAPMRYSPTKEMMYRQLAAAGIPVPKTFMLTARAFIEDCLHFFDTSFPLVVKVHHNALSEHGIGVMLAESEQGFRAIIDMCLSVSGSVMVQEFIAEGSGSDYRVVVLDDEVIATVKRDNTKRDFRSNVLLGGIAAPAMASPEQCEAAVKAAHAFGARFAGVDLLGSPHAPIVTEVNSPCDYTFVEQATNCNIVQRLFDVLLF